MTKFKHRERHVWRTEHVNGIDDNGSYIDRAMTSVQPANAPYISRELMNTYTPLKQYPATPIKMRVIIEDVDKHTRIKVPCKPYTYRVFGKEYTATERVKDTPANRYSFYVLAFFDEDALSQVIDRLAGRGITLSWASRITIVNRYRRYTFNYYNLFDECFNLHNAIPLAFLGRTATVRLPRP